MVKNQIREIYEAKLASLNRQHLKALYNYQMNRCNSLDEYYLQELEKVERQIRDTQRELEEYDRERGIVKTMPAETKPRSEAREKAEKPRREKQKEPIATHKPIKMDKSQLHEYQKRAANHIAQHPNAILSVDMGLGKTAATLAWLDWLIGKGKAESALIVAPKRVAENNWKQESEVWGFNEVASRAVIVKGDKKRRLAALADEAHPVKIIGRDNLADLQDADLMGFDALIIDELTSFKNPDSKRSEIIGEIVARYKVGLTGTLLANGAIDIYGQCAAVGLAELWHCPNFYAWRSAFFRDVLKGAGLAFSKWQLIVPLANLLKPIEDSIFTLTAEDYLTIPPKTETTHRVEVGASIRKNIAELDAFLATIINEEAVAVREGGKFAKLQTLCNGFVYTDEGEAIRSEESAKLEAVADFVEDCKDAGESVLLFYAFREEEKWLREMLEKRHIKCDSVKADGFLERWNAHETECLFAHPASAGHGLNLQHGGRTIVWSTMTYNYEFFAQGNARLARQGQRNNVQIHYFVADGTCEEAIVKALQRKQGEQDKFLELTKQ